MDSPEVKRRNNSLTQAQASRLYRWLEESRTFASTATAQKCAELAARELGIGITSSNVLSAKRSLGITKPAPVKPEGEYRLRVLAAAVVALYDYEGIAPTAALLDMAGINRHRATPQAPTLPGVVVPVAPGVSLAMGAGDAARLALLNTEGAA